MRRLDWRKTACAVCVLCATTAIALPAQTFKTVFSFYGTDDGYYPYGVLVQGTDGNFYGTTCCGGALDGSGTVFKITPSGMLKTLYTFCQEGPPCADGAYPYAGLILATDGNFYGTTTSGGTNGADDGTVFKISPSGALTTLYSFCSQNPPYGCTDGGGPQAALIQASDGNFYGTTVGGGVNEDGTAFKITPGGTLTTLYSFCSQSGCTDGGSPYAGLVQGTDGSFYGTTIFGGVTGYDSGTVFKITPTGTLTTLYSFCSQSGCTDGQRPEAGLVQAMGGNFYGTTAQGGANSKGTVFEITPAGALTTLYSFCPKKPYCTDGEGPYGTLAQGTDGNFYGTTTSGGTNNDGTVFKITPDGTLTRLHSFDGTGGYEPEAALIQDTNGKLYGTTIEGAGGENGGTVFSLSVGLGPFVETQPTSGPVGSNVKILGTGLAAATGVTFNGTVATFTVASSSLITTTVPAGATTGEVEVTTPHGTLSSNVPFRVIQ